MRILMTQRELVHWGGSQMFTIEVAKELSKRGHEVAVFCPRAGDLAKIIYPSGVWVKCRLDEVPWEPDIIHGQHHLQTVAALSFFLDVPAIYYCHGLIPWVEQVPLHPRIRNYVMMCEWMVSPIATEFGIPRDHIVAIPNFVNTNRFSQVRSPPDRPRRALLFGNSGLPANELLRLERACFQEGMSLDKIGYAYGNPQERPETFLPDYDLVFAVGRSAIEALSCGCAVIPIVPGQAGHLVTMENFADWVYSNFIPVYGTSATQINADWLKRELLSYSPETTSKVSGKLRTEHNLFEGVNRIEEIYNNTLIDYKNNTNARTREFAPYLEKMSLEVDAMWQQTHKVKQLNIKLREAKAKLRKAHQDQIKRLNIQLREAHQELRSMRSSTSWRLSKAIRVVGSLLRRRPAKQPH